MPSEEDLLKDLKQEYDLVPQRLGTGRAIGVQVKMLGIDKSTQTGRPPCRTIIVYENQPLTDTILSMIETQTPPAMLTNPPEFPHPSSSRETLLPTDPIDRYQRRFWGKRSSRCVTPSDEDWSLTKKATPKPAPINPRGCWNCGGDHRYNRCPKHLKLFCFRCGEPGYTSDRCPHCN